MIISVSRVLILANAVIAIALAPLGYPALAQQQPSPPTAELRAVNSAPPLGLEQATQLALANSQGIKNAELDLEIGQNRIQAAKTFMLPKVHLNAAFLQLITPLDFGFTKGSLGTDEFNRPLPSKNVNVNDSLKPLFVLNASVIQPIFQLGRVKIGIRQAQLAKIIAQDKLTLQRQQVVNQIKHAYYKGLELQQALPAIQATQTMYKEIDRTTDEFLKVKAVPLGDSLETKQLLARAEYDEQHLMGGLQSVKEQINQYIGRDPNTDFDLVMVDDPPSINVTASVAQARALQVRTEIKQANNETQQINLARQSKKLEYLPDLSVGLDYLSIFGAQDILPKNVLFAGLFANWEPIDWGKKKAELSVQRKQIRQANNSLQQLQNQVVVEVNDACRRLKDSKSLAHVSQLGQQTAQERLRVSANKYKEKAALLREVLQAQRDLLQANTQYTQALLALWTARADLEKAVGED